MAKKEEFFTVVREKKELEQVLEGAEKEYYENTYWEAPQHVIEEEYQKLEQFRKDIQTKREKLEELRKTFTRDELRAMFKEFYGYGESN